MLIALFVLLLNAVLFFYIFRWESLPDVNQMKGCMTSSLYSVDLCNKNPSYTSIKEIPEYLIDALLIAEDAGFYYHDGFDWYEVFESIKKNLETGEYTRGASTITQQLAKNVFLNDDKSIRRKLREALLTRRIEQNFTKDEILEKYLNVVELGPNLFGLHAAANYYFQKKPQDLALLESVFLVQLLPNPKIYSYSFRKNEPNENLRERMKRILTKLKQYDKLKDIHYEVAIVELQYPPWTL